MITTHSRTKTIGTPINRMPPVVSIVSLMFSFLPSLPSLTHVSYNRQYRLRSWSDFWGFRRVHVVRRRIFHSIFHTFTFWEPRRCHRRWRHRWYSNNLHRRCCNLLSTTETFTGGVRRRRRIRAYAKRWDGCAVVIRITANNEVLCAFSCTTPLRLCVLMRHFLTISMHLGPR
jgi:hypothetical protein